MAILGVINQTMLPDELVIYDDNDQPVDLRQIQHYFYLLHMLQIKGIKWRVEPGERKGQHFNHQKANKCGYKWVWRLDDDTVAEPNVLETLFNHTDDTVGAVGGSVLTPPFNPEPINGTGKIQDIFSEPNMQWSYIDKVKEVDHLHCSFLYRAGVVDYNLNLSRVAHREETLFTYKLKKKGYRNLLVPCVTWHMRNNQGGIRDGQVEMFNHDESIFVQELSFDNVTSIMPKQPEPPKVDPNREVVVMNNGRGDHLVFSRVYEDMKDRNPLVYTCYPDIIPGGSIAEALNLYGDCQQYDIYRKMDEWNWKGSLEDAFRKLYNVPRKD
jgi:hypothetical protein